MTVPQIVSLLYSLEVTRDRDDNGWEDVEYLQGVWGNGTRSVLKWLKRERPAQLAARDHKNGEERYQYRAKKTMRGGLPAWEIQWAVKGDKVQWRVMETYRIDERQVRV